MALTKVTSGLISADASSVDLNIDAGTLYIDSTNNRVGIGETSPSEKLNVAGNIMLEGADQYLYLTNVGTGNSGIYVRGNTAGSYLRSHSTGIFTWEVTGSEKMRLDGTGLGIGQSPSGYNKLEVNGDISTEWGASPTNIGMKYVDGTSYYLGLQLIDSNRQTRLVSKSADNTGYIAFDTGASPTERMRINSSGNVGIGTSSPSTKLHVVGDSSSRNTITANLTLDGGSTVGNPFDGFGFGINFIGRDYGNAVRNYAHIYSVIETQSSSAGGGDPGFKSFLSFYTNSGGASGTNPTEKMRIESNGAVLIGKTGQSLATEGAELLGPLTRMTRSGAQPLEINRLSNDGALIYFYQDTVNEGSISVSGTTVSYNGGHLSRWSQLSDNTKDETIVKGTVMTNLNQMAEWTTDGVTEANEQLNCMAVSSVEGDVNVAGVFVNWDEEDEVYTADMNVAMTGDMVIRIAQGVTVAQGDLLMSAGDGTAKPQDDDIIRAKTIAKVTSTHVSHTYDDGSYLVPCVLMAC